MTAQKQKFAVVALDCAAMADKPGLKEWRSLRLGLIVLALGAPLAGCIPVIATGVVAGTYAATDRRSVGAISDDKVISVRADNLIEKEFGDGSHITVTSFNRKVLLTGEVPDDRAKVRAERIVNGVENVTGVVNELAVSPPSSFTSRSSDTFITSEVKAHLINEKDIYANVFKVVTERGTVYLMGRVTEREGDYAANIARQIGGVLGVVKVFDYISEDELKLMNTQAAPS
ncbi:MAG: BON domain-containing protein [Burkholderiaceae bacterium]|jgi:osmotically-inducible protein OsmY